MNRPAPAATDGLAQRLRAATRRHHTEAERAGIMPALLRGTLPLGVYVALLRNLHMVYAALEAGLAAQADHPSLAAVWQPALHRRAALEDDLLALRALVARARDGIGNGDDLTHLRPAALAYAQHLARVTHAAPHLLAAHVYVRYLGDLSGGQILARIVGTAYGLVDGRGTRFYDFGSAADTTALAAGLRRGLDALPVDSMQADAIVAEACSAFERHVRLFAELER